MASNNFRSAFAQFSKVAKTKGENHNRRIMLYLNARVNLMTPVREGVLRENWELHPDYPGADFLPDRKNDPGGSVRKAAAIIASEQINGRRWFFSNSTPYAFPIEFGYSTQRPEGMVRVSVEHVANLIKRKLL